MSMSSRTRRAAGVATLLVFIAASHPAGQAVATPPAPAPASASTQTAASASAKKPIPHDAYDAWKAIQDTTLSRDGVWLAYTLAPQDGDGELVVRNLNTGVEHRQPRGNDPVITPDGAYVVFQVLPLDALVDKAKRAKKKPEDMPKGGIGVMTLANGQVWTADRIKSFKLPEDSSAAIAYLREPAEKPADVKAADDKKAEEKSAGDKKKEKKKEPGTPLIVRQLATGAEATIADVTDYVWTKDGSWLTYAVSSADPKADGAYARRATDGSTRTLLAGLGHYKALAVDEAGRQAAFVSDREDYQSKTPRYRLYRWTSDATAAVETVSASTTGMPRDAVVSEFGTLSFSKDGTRLFFGTAPAPVVTPDAGDDGPEPIKVDLWHWKDPQLQPVQKVNAEQDRKRNFRAVVNLATKKIVQLATADMPTVAVPEQGAYALGSADSAYRISASWEGNYDDLVLLNLNDGTSRTIAQKTKFEPTFSPNGGYVLYFDSKDNAWYAVRTSDGRKTNLTGSLKVSFTREEFDSPDVPPPYGVAGWTDDDRSVLLYDKFDIWEIKPDGSDAHTVTNGAGRAQQLMFRALRLDPKARAFPASAPLLMSAVDTQTKASGFYRVDLKAGASASPVKLLMVDKAAGVPIKARNADRLVVTFSRFEEFPDLWQTTATFAEPRKISDANPQQAQFVWGRSELINYRNADGKMLRAVLTKPEDFDPAKKYPLMVYIYERLTDNLHTYVPPAPGTSINVTRYASHGYVVLQPDIVYDTGYPGESAMKCVLPAVQTVLALGYVDPQRVGIQGHSWGGYQISYLITRTDIFRAVEAGASVVNMVSAYGGIRWGTGISRAFQYEHTQSRIGGAPWDKPLQFIENSPIFWVEKVKTPYLTIHNDEDDAVPWYQGIEFFTALRRLGKEGYLFSYNGEKHGLRERENQKHWTVHMAEYFDYYLLKTPKPAWMESGVPYLERGTRDLTPFYGKPKTTNDEQVH